MIMANTTLISVRIDTDTLEKIEEFAEHRRYWKRSGIINSVLTSIFLNAQPEDIQELITWWRHSSTKLTISVHKSEV